QDRGARLATTGMYEQSTRLPLTIDCPRDVAGGPPRASPRQWYDDTHLICSRSLGPASGAQCAAGWSTGRASQRLTRRRVPGITGRVSSRRRVEPVHIELVVVAKTQLG